MTAAPTPYGAAGLVEIRLEQVLVDRIADGLVYLGVIRPGVIAGVLLDAAGAAHVARLLVEAAGGAAGVDAPPLSGQGPDISPRGGESSPADGLGVGSYRVPAGILEEEASDG